KADVVDRPRLHSEAIIISRFWRSRSVPSALLRRSPRSSKKPADNNGDTEMTQEAPATEGPPISMRALLEAGVHFGHNAGRWNPKMKPYIFGARNGIHIIDLQHTVKLFKKACDFIEQCTSRGGHVLFVGTKRLSRELVAQEATRAGQFYMNHRWLGGTLTNFP